MQTPTPITRRPVRPTTAVDLHRLAAQGAANGVQLFTEAATGARFASSASEPGVVYYVTGFSCTCRGFTHHQRCQHHATLLAELGWLPDIEPEPEPTGPAACAACDGSGHARVYAIRTARYAYRPTCATCKGSGEATPALHPAA